VTKNDEKRISNPDGFGRRLVESFWWAAFLDL